MAKPLLQLQNVLTPLLLLVIIVLATILWQQETRHQERLSALETQQERASTDLASTTASASSTIALLEAELRLLKEEYGILSEDYSGERERNEDFEKQIRTISKTVGVLDKLSKTDEELLQKYSKVSFLNEHYVPEKLSNIDAAYLYDESREQQIHSLVLPYLSEMIDDAKADGIDLWVVSAFRSFEQQAQLKGQYLVTYGTGANAFSADQGFSEHQLGTTLDLTTKGLGGGLQGFGDTPAYTWLKENAHKYGFVLSYPENNQYYIFEPWHWRFVGEDLASDLKRANAHFYDWDQRKIDEYLIKIFD